MRPGTGLVWGQRGPCLGGLRAPGRGGAWECGGGGRAQDWLTQAEGPSRSGGSRRPTCSDSPPPWSSHLSLSPASPPESSAFSFAFWKPLPPSLCSPSQPCQLSLIPRGPEEGKGRPSVCSFPSETHVGGSPCSCSRRWEYRGAGVPASRAARQQQRQTTEGTEEK